MSSFYWIKLYQDILRDPKMGRLSDSAFRRCIELFLLAGEHPDRDGTLPDFEDMAWTLRITRDQLDEDWQELERAEIVTLKDGLPFVCNFDKRQEAMTSAERVRRHRKRKQREQFENANEAETEPENNEDETKPKPEGNAGETERYTDKEEETETESEPDTESEKDNDNHRRYAVVKKAYENEIGDITPAISKKLQAAIEKHPTDWIVEAIGIAATHEARNLAYINGILNNWSTKGRGARKRASPSSKEPWGTNASNASGEFWSS